ncbi:inducible metalloproteinase inhibitor protein-like [Spodoptera litura]|uniref:Inducible metalloproteinase inhibitor protein-like n=1 Tax=Spodoptera litura TaxID=69820 RepID=A0A9J7DUN1_SPOLT|nr:inducible metalloproteinase inhibitor protein-like [Spodoptera litura]
MWRCAVLLSVCCVGLVASQGLLDGFNPFRVHMDCGPNETFNPCTQNCGPEQTCDTRKIHTLCPAIVMPCVPKCVCKQGHYRKTEGGECIPEEECGPACGEYEVYTECTNPCVNDSCEAMGSLKPNCTSPVPCKPGCVCAEGAYRLYEYWPCVPKCYCHGMEYLPECRKEER